MSGINLGMARTIIAAALAKGRELGLKPLSVVVLDSGGHTIAFERDDGASALRFAIAAGKAGGAIALGVSSKTIGQMAQERPTFLSAIAHLAPTGIVPAAGGVLVVDDEGSLLGAVGVTGDTSDNDEICALAGIESAGLAVAG